MRKLSSVPGSGLGLGVGISLCLSSLAMAQQMNPDDWNDAKPSTTITILAGSQPDTFMIRAVITDLTTSRVLDKPALLVKAGQSATMEIGSQTKVSFRLTVTVDPSGRTAVYSSEVRRDGKIESAQTATVAVVPKS